MAERFQSLANLPQYGRIRNRAELPFGLAEKLTINTQAVGWLLQLGGYNPLYLFSDDSKQPEEVSFIVSGVSPTGAASAHLLRAKKPALGSVYDHSGSNRQFHGSRSHWTSLDITLHTDAILKKLYEQNCPVQDRVAWAAILDTYIRTVLISQSLKSTLALKFAPLFDDLTAVLFAEITYGLLWPYYQVMLGTDFSKGAMILSHIAVWSVLKNMLGAYLEGLEDGESGHRLSLLGSLQFDRALGVLAVGAVAPLIRAEKK